MFKSIGQALMKDGPKAVVAFGVRKLPEHEAPRLAQQHRRDRFLDSMIAAGKERTSGKTQAEAHASPAPFESFEGCVRQEMAVQIVIVMGRGPLCSILSSASLRGPAAPTVRRSCKSTCVTCTSRSSDTHESSWLESVRHKVLDCKLSALRRAHHILDGVCQRCVDVSEEWDQLLALKGFVVAALNHDVLMAGGVVNVPKASSLTLPSKVSNTTMSTGETSKGKPRRRVREGTTMPGSVSDRGAEAALDTTKVEQAVSQRLRRVMLRNGRLRCGVIDGRMGVSIQCDGNFARDSASEPQPKSDLS
ncbi:hypothetical protein DOTSEDRAFT_39634 [Dothistroma septosporum NZE10]|uniref:Uncharacterized protein n=1 Tax=Dothistroma septosporum (strain NZE10 / CBS 128990) TaxID=675120 RepID=M2YHU1_DOTSN|nr:hypothetical protein DOTSEDRAFT_39634 [Dothistroma septosporum NZE10]